MAPAGNIRKFRACALLAALVLTLAGAAPARAVEPGVVSDLTWYIPDADKDRSIQATQDLGSRWTRLHVQWSEAEPSEGALNEWWIAEYEESIDRARAAGQKVVLMLYNAPAWASGSSTRNTPRDPADFASFAARLAHRFRGKVTGYEIWNEPNIERFWSNGPDAREYADLLRAAHPAIKAVDPGAEIVFGGLSGNDYPFLKRAYEAGAEGSFDVMGAHPYTYCGSTGPGDVRRSGGRITPDSFTGYRELRATMVAEGDSHPIWVTEFGWNTSNRKCDPGAGFWQGGVNAADQAKYLSRGFEIMDSDPYVEVAMWYSLRDPYWLEGASDDPESSTGLLTVGYGTKPAYSAFRSFARGGVGGEAPAQPTTPPEADPQVSISLKLKKLKRRHRAARATGRVTGSTAGEVALVVERRRAKGWSTVAAPAAVVGSNGRFARALALPGGRVRVHAELHAGGAVHSSQTQSLRGRRR